MASNIFRHFLLGYSTYHGIEIAVRWLQDSWRYSKLFPYVILRIKKKSGYRYLSTLFFVCIYRLSIKNQENCAYFIKHSKNCFSVQRIIFLSNNLRYAFFKAFLKLIRLEFNIIFTKVPQIYRVFSIF